MRITLGSPAEAGRGIGALIGVATAASVIYVTPSENFNELAILLIPICFAWFTFFGGACGHCGALLQSRMMAAIVGSSIAVLPFLIARFGLLLTEPHIGGPPGYRVELVSAAFGAIAGLVGNLIAARMSLRSEET